MAVCMRQNASMVRPASPTPAPAGTASPSPAYEFLTALDKYTADFDLMISAWKTRDVYDVVSEEFVSLAQLQKARFPEAAVVMLDLHRSRSVRAPSRFSDEVMQARQATHGLAVDALRSYVLKKTH